MVVIVSHRRFYLSDTQAPDRSDKRSAVGRRRADGEQALAYNGSAGMVLTVLGFILAADISLL